MEAAPARIKVHLSTIIKETIRQASTLPEFYGKLVFFFFWKIINKHKYLKVENRIGSSGGFVILLIIFEFLTF